VSRRGLTTLLAMALAVGLAILGGAQHVPYVVLSPGPAFNTLGAVNKTEVLGIKGGRTYPTDGALDATTVSVTDHVTLFEALQGWLSGDDAVVPRELIYPPEQTQQQTDQQNTEDMLESQYNALVAAMKVLGIPGTTQVTIKDITPKGPSDGHLQPGDVIATVDGEPVATVARLRQLISSREAGRTVEIGYTRSGKAGTVTLTTTATPDAQHRAIIGITASIRPHHPVDVAFQLRDSNGGAVGGPSAGLMFALGIIDKLQPGSLTGGRLIAGTGEIDPDGKVGAIGGIAQKMRGARHEKATVFLVPAANCEEARATRPSGLQLIRVTTLEDALSALKTLRSGGTPPSC
jgi:PDZ domain-containing protein